MEDLKSLTLHWRSFPGCRRERLSTYSDHKGGQFFQKEHRRTIVNILRLTVRYLNVTIYRTTRNAKPEIGPDRSSQTRQNPWVDGYGARFGTPRSSWSGLWTVLKPKWTIFLVQTRTAGGFPGSVTNTITSYWKLLRNVECGSIDNRDILAISRLSWQKI